MPTWRSASLLMVPGSSRSGAWVASTTTKSLPAPCILVNFRRIGGSCRNQGPGHDVVIHEKTVANVRFRGTGHGKTIAQIGGDRSVVEFVDLQIQIVHAEPPGRLCHMFDQRRSVALSPDHLMHVEFV